LQQKTAGGGSNCIEWPKNFIGISDVFAQQTTHGLCRFLTFSIAM
jgi:hypothetical protein